MKSAEIKISQSIDIVSKLMYYSYDTMSDGGGIEMNRFEESKEVFNKLFGELPAADKEIDLERFDNKAI